MYVAYLFLLHLFLITTCLTSYKINKTKKVKTPLNAAMTRLGDQLKPA